jgi:hypothetical protein
MKLANDNYISNPREFHTQKVSKNNLIMLLEAGTATPSAQEP